jgi:hypothetical protein
METCKFTNLSKIEFENAVEDYWVGKYPDWLTIELILFYEQYTIFDYVKDKLHFDFEKYWNFGMTYYELIGNFNSIKRKYLKSEKDYAKEMSIKDLPNFIKNLIKFNPSLINPHRCPKLQLVLYFSDEKLWKKCEFYEPSSAMIMYGIRNYWNNKLPIWFNMECILKTKCHLLIHIFDDKYKDPYYAMNWCIINKKFNYINWLYNEIGEGYSEKTLELLLKDGKFDTIVYFHNNRHYLYPLLAYPNNRPDIIQWMDSKRKKPKQPMRLDSGSLDVFMMMSWLQEI